MDGVAKTRGHQARTRWLIAAGIFLGTLALYARVAGHPFIFFDDSIYVTDNPHVRTGLTAANVAWALTGQCAGNWHPLTMLSHMADCQLFGVAAGPAHHGEPALPPPEHPAAVPRLAADDRGLAERLRRGPVRRPPHPRRVGGLDRRAQGRPLDALLAADDGTCATPAVGARPPMRTWCVVAFFAAGLMAKPMLVTLPFVLVLLDFWPLGRIRSRRAAAARPAERGVSLARSLVLEKLPLLLLVLVSVVLTLRAQEHRRALRYGQPAPGAGPRSATPRRLRRYLPSSSCPRISPHSTRIA